MFFSLGHEVVVEKLMTFRADPFKIDSSNRTARSTVAGQIFSRSSLVDCLLKYGEKHALFRSLSRVIIQSINVFKTHYFGAALILLQNTGCIL